MSVKLQYLIFTTLYIAHSVQSAAIEPTSGDLKGSNKRDSRSPRCKGSKCRSFIENHQMFKASVTFNTYINSSGCCDENCKNPPPPEGTTDPPPVGTNKPPAPPTTRGTTNKPPIGETTPKPPAAPKTKVFEVEFNMEEFKGFDLYYLQDGTETFDADRALLAKAAPEFLQSLKNLSNEFQLGFGVFGDKYAYNRNSWAYQNLMPLSKDTSKFSSIVSSVEHLYGGDDDEEDPLTAIHQIGVCQKELQWRNNVTRVLLVTTDEDFQNHTNKRFENRTVFNGSECYLKNGIVNDSLYVWQLNYPTLEDMQQSIKENFIKVVFAISNSTRPTGEPTPSIRERYKNFAKKLDPTPIVLGLEHNSANVIDVVKEAIRQVTNPLKIETILFGPKDKTDAIIVTAKCAKDPPAQDDFPHRLIDSSMCAATKSKIVKYIVTVTMPCDLDLTDVTLRYHVQGHAMPKFIDIKSVCQ